MAQSAASQELRKTPFHARHLALGARMVPFAGYEMPVQYATGITAEHHAVRQRCGLFDVSHMGEIEVTGADACAFVNYVTTNDVGALEVGQAQYSMLLNERGTILDDCLVYRFEDRVMIVVNASNRERDFSHLSAHLDRFECIVSDISDDIALLALQGPHAERILAPLSEVELSKIAYYHFREGKVAGAPAIISRTGYTGEDGFELYFSPEHADRVWDALVGDGGVTPAGLGARDTLRLEAGMALYGNDIDEETNPYEANLGWTVKLRKGEFIGREALLDIKERGPRRKLVGLTTSERAFPRPGYPVYYRGERSGEIRSGTMSPTLGIPIATAYLPVEGTKEAESAEFEIRSRRIDARVVKLPFYRRPERG